jgi:tRNA(Ile)-lysidine synthase
MSIREQVIASIGASGLVEPDMRVLAMLSGGADSVCLTHALRELLGSPGVRALHVNHGLRARADDDERFCAELCQRLGLDLDVEQLQIATSGNLEAHAREARYDTAERLRASRGLDRIATGHTATDQLETVVYRLACSPGRRALLGISRQRGHLIRPLLDLTSEQTRDYCSAVGLDWREDESNLDRSFARNRLRLDVVPVLREIHSAVELNVLSTSDQLREEAELLETAIDEALLRVAATDPVPSVDGARLRELPVALRRLVLRRLVEQAAGAAVPLRAAQVRAIERLVERGGTAALDVGAGVRVVSEYGILRFQRGIDGHEREPASLPVPGRCRFGDWEVVCDLEGSDESPPSASAARDEAVLDAAKLAQELTVRTWHDGDRMRPLGLGGSKSLQDLFTDRKVPRSLRHDLPVVESGGEIAWVAGVEISDLFKVTAETARIARLRALAAPKLRNNERPP